jgi:hypothetical protein
LNFPLLERSIMRIMALVLVAMLFIVPLSVSAAPEPAQTALQSSPQTPDWITPDVQSQLAGANMPVLAPSYIPGPFGSLPSISASDGYYQLYWLIPGTPATYLLVTGTVGGSIPAYSEYDRNVELTQNDSVLGTPAYHDQTPIYDRIYFAIGGVVYMVDSNNIGDSTSGIANSMSYVDLPEPEAPVETPPPDTGTGETDTGGDTSTGETDTSENPVNAPTEDVTGTSDSSTDTSSDAPVDSTSSDTTGSPTISVAESAMSDDVIAVTVDGVSAADLKASSGKFELTSKTSVEGAEPSSFNWTAPWTDKGRTVKFTLTDPATGEVIATASTRVEPIPDDQIPVVADTIACPTQIEMGSMGGIAIKGSGQLIMDASDGTFPDAGPNPGFASEIDGSDVLTGVIRREKTVWIFWEPVESSESYTAYIFLQDYAGNTLLECGIDVVPAGELPTYPDMGPQDGSGIVAGLGIAELANSSGLDGTLVASSDHPAAGQTSSGTALSLAPDATDDGTNVTDPNTSPEATPNAGT